MEEGGIAGINGFPALLPIGSVENCY